MCAACPWTKYVFSWKSLSAWESSGIQVSWEDIEGFRSTGTVKREDEKIERD